ncbi:ribonuclease J [candidate division WWE3 bacterium]|nr:ribonuclease J [candidate division WWE3 bacterium]
MKFKFSKHEAKGGSPISPQVRIITLGGTTAVTKNMTVYECQDTIIVVDCGFGFPDSEMLGVDVVLPDITYLQERKNKVKAIFISHGHDDHVGAIPFVIKNLNVPIYSTRLVQGLIQVKLREKNMLEGVSLKLVDPEVGTINVGPFTVDYFRVNHSVPDSSGISIKTPAGTVFHCPDFKFDWTPVLDKPFDVAKMCRLAVGGVDLLLSDCLGSTTEGYARSEKSIEDTFNDLLNRAEGKQVFITTDSSNVSRMAQAINSAIRHGRKVVTLGRSIDQVVDVSRKLGYLSYDESVFVAREKAKKHPQSSLLYIVAGAYGQLDSAISRVSRDEHKDVEIEDGAWVIFSADPNPPGVRDRVDALIDRLTLKNAIVVYSEIQENLHVSGHGLRGDLKLMAALTKPDYFMPIGGTVKHMRAYANMISEMGVNRENIFEPLEGDSLILKDGQVRKGDPVPVSNIYVDGSVVGDVGEKVIEDRNVLASDGIVVVVVPVKGNDELGRVDIITRGFVYVKESRALIADSTEVIRKTFNQNKGDLRNRGLLKSKLEQSLSKFLYKQTGREPLVLVTIVG